MEGPGAWALLLAVGSRQWAVDGGGALPTQYLYGPTRRNSSASTARAGRYAALGKCLLSRDEPAGLCGGKR